MSQWHSFFHFFVHTCCELIYFAGRRSFLSFGIKAGVTTFYFVIPSSLLRDRWHTQNTDVISGTMYNIRKKHRAILS